MKDYLMKLIDDKIFCDTHPMEIDPLCCDNKIHVRLRDFNKKHFYIQTLEDKLALCIGMRLASLIEDSDLNLDQVDDYIWTKYLNKLYSEEDFKQLIQKFSSYFPNFKGLVIMKKYQKKSPKNSILKVFGTIPTSIKLQLSSYLERLNLSWIDFVLDDNIIFEVNYQDKQVYVTAKEDRLYSKYLNRTKKKLERLFWKNVEEENLW